MIYSQEVFDVRFLTYGYDADDEFDKIMKSDIQDPTLSKRILARSIVINLQILRLSVTDIHCMTIEEKNEYNKILEELAQHLFDMEPVNSEHCANLLEFVIIHNNLCEERMNDPESIVRLDRLSEILYEIHPYDEF